MPFTLAHPAAIIPFRRFAGQNTSLSALVIGSMAPDLAYFLPLGVNGRFSHSPIGIFLFCIPVSLIAYVIFHSLARQPLIALMPQAISSRLHHQSTEWIPKTIASLALIVVAIIIGAVTHVAWDSFTHRNTAIVRSTEFLQIVVGPADGPRIPVYKILQHASSVLGLTILAGSVFQWMRRTPPVAANRPQLDSRYRGMIFAAILIAGVLGGIIYWMSSPTRILERAIVKSVVGGMTGIASATLLFCACWQIWALRSQRSG